MPTRTPPAHTLPWSAGTTPLMLAPMQGLTNRALRALFVEWVRPDTVFTEFMRVSNVSERQLRHSDLADATATAGDVPLVAQLVGSDKASLVSAARSAEAAGARHLNLNLGCPFGRMTTGATGGVLLRHPERLAEIVPALRATVTGSFSVKVRAGYADPGEIFDLLPMFAAAGVDFLVLHPRTVLQKYAGAADHAVTRRVVAAARMPVIANGDIRSAADGLRVLADTGAAGLMLGRGAIADPLLFERLRQRRLDEPTAEETAAMLQRYLRDLLARYRQLFCGEQQVLGKVKTVLAMVDAPPLARRIGKLQRTNSIAALSARIEELAV